MYVFSMHNMLLYRNTSSSCGISVILVVELCSSHSAKFESHFLNAVKTSAMNFNFDVAHHTDLPKSQIYIYIYPTCIETILNFHSEEILCMTLSIW